MMHYGKVEQKENDLADSKEKIDQKEHVQVTHIRD